MANIGWGNENAVDIKYPPNDTPSLQGFSVSDVIVVDKEITNWSSLTLY